ncbi:unnamed protein product [Cylindrotheca closterium]|uniref:Uncharacterized protein n=1 Tax=Cylindrotheca closterium TaxID=2856 RepID=A0AAD2G3G0_9STRA|nr:unnamed protein product [Cylindrotheca closterium]
MQKKGVTMNESVEVVEILHVNDFTASEIAASWYDEEEMKKITERCFKVLQRMEYGKTKNGKKKYCTRGLEGHTALGSISKKKTRAAAFSAVLDEQEKRWNENKDVDFQAISDAYRKVSSSSQMWAQVIGNRDHHAIEAYLYQDEEKDEEVDATTTTVSTSALKSPGSQKITLKNVGSIVHQGARAA